MASDAQEKRNQRARELGFRNDYDMRQWINDPANKTSVQAGKAFVMEDHGTYDPLKAKEYWESIGHYIYTEKGNPRRNVEVTGEMRHEAIAYLMEWDDISREDAIDYMREIYGDSGEESE